MVREVGPWDATAAAGLSRLLRRHGPFDIVHAHSSKAGALTRLLPWRAGRMVYSPHAFSTLDLTSSPVRRSFYELVERVLMHRTDLLIASSAHEAAEARRLGLSKRRIAEVLNGMRPPDFLSRAEARLALGVAADAVCVGFVGRLSAQKRPQRFLQVMDALHHPRLQGVLIGDGEQRAAVQAGLAALPPRRVTLHRSDTAWRYMPAFDLLVLTSAYEGMPYVVLEALHAGLPVVADTVGGVGEMVREGVNGFILPYGAPAQAMAERAQRLLDRPELRADMAQASLARARAFDVEAMATQVLAAYEAALDPGRALAYA